MFWFDRGAGRPRQYSAARGLSVRDAERQNKYDQGVDTLMTTRFAALALSLSALLGVSILAHAPARAATADCDRACLNGIVEKYVAALQARDPKQAPIARGTRYSENGVDLTLPDGLWRTVGKVSPYRLVVADPKEGSVGFFIKADENGTTVLVGTRLKVVKQEITEIESYGARLSNTVGGANAALFGPEILGDTTRKQFVTAMAPEKRRSREALSAIVNSYFTGLENNHGDKVPNFADDCYRIENGSATTGRPVTGDAKPGAANYGCKEAFGLGYYRDDTRLRNRRILAIDEERQVVYAGVFFDHDATIRSYQIKDGRTVTVRNTAPWTWGIHEVFQINEQGQISQVEAVLLSVPYGMRPAFSTGVHMPSPQARKDGFKEY
jgi:hypothetical protein